MASSPVWNPKPFDAIVCAKYGIHQTVLVDNGHFANWIAAVRSRDPNRLTGEISEGHMSSRLCFLGNVAYETQRTLRFYDQTERFIGDDDANRLLTRTMNRCAFASGEDSYPTDPAPVVS